MTLTLAAFILLVVLAVRTADGERSLPAVADPPLAEAAVAAPVRAATPAKAAAARKRAAKPRGRRAVTRAASTRSISASARPIATGPARRATVPPPRILGRGSLVGRTPVVGPAASTTRKPSGDTGTSVSPPPPPPPPRRLRRIRPAGASPTRRHHHRPRRHHLPDPTPGQRLVRRATSATPAPRPTRFRRPGGSGGSSVPVP